MQHVLDGGGCSPQSQRRGQVNELASFNQSGCAGIVSLGLFERTESADCFHLTNVEMNMVILLIAKYV